MYIVSFINCSQFVHNLFTISYARAHTPARARARARTHVKALDFAKFSPEVYVVITRRGIMH